MSTHLRQSCSCQDCQAVCPADTVYPAETERQTIGQLDLVAFISIITMICLIVLFALGQYFQSKPQNQVKKYNFMVKIEKKLNTFYLFWVTFILNNILLTIIVTISFAAFLLSGLIFVEFTTDPIKLWTSSSSRSYIE